MTNETPSSPTPFPFSVTRIFDGMALVLMLAILITIPLSLAVIWLTTQLEERTPLDEFVPNAPGTTLVYHVTLPDGTEHYKTSNVGRSNGNDGLVILDVEASAEVMRRLTGSSDLNSQDVEQALETESQKVKVARLVETTYSTTTTLGVVSSYFLLHDHQIELISIDQQNFLPFLPFYDASLTPGSSLNSSGTYGISSPYSATLTFEGEEPVETPLKRFESCQRFLLTIEITDILYRQLRSWFCAGIGLTVQESTDNHAVRPTRLLLIAAHTDSLTLNGDVRPFPTPTLDPPTVTSGLGSEWERIWSFNDGSRQRRDLSTQVVAAGDFYLFGDEEGHLLAIHRATHTLAWRFQTGNALYATPVVADGVVYSASSDGNLYALDLRNGAFRWAFRTRDILSSSPAIADGKVYLGAEDRTLYVLDAQTGIEQWRYEVGGPIAASPVVSNGVVYVGADDGGLYALDIATGKPRWIFPGESGINGSVAVADGIVYVGNVEGWVYALNPETTLPRGEVLWEYETEDSIISDLIVKDTLLYVTIPNAVYALETRTGREAWRFTSEFEVNGTPLLLFDYAFINLGRMVAMLDSQTGQPVSRIPIASPDSDTPLGSDGENLLIGHIDGTMSVMTGNPAHPWHGEAAWVSTDLTNALIENSDTLSTPPVLYGDDLIYVSTYGRLFRVNRTTGASTFLGETDLQLAYLPPIVSNHILIAGNFFGQLTAFNLQDNTIQWQIDFNTATFTPVYLNGTHLLWAATVEDELIAYAFDLATGETVWQQAFPYALAAGPGSVLHNGTFYVVGDSLTALNPATGEVLWQSTEPFRPLFLTAMDDQVYAMAITEDFATLVVGWDINRHTVATVIPYETDALPALYGGISSGNGVVLLASEMGNLLALDVNTRAVRWQVNNGRGVQGIPLFMAETILYTSADNHLHARNLSDGHLVGDFASPTTPMSPTDVDGAMAPLLLEGSLYLAAYQEAFALKLRE